MGKSNFGTTIERGVDDGCIEIDVDVSFSYTGGCAVHMGSISYAGHPAEDPEIEILQVMDIETGDILELDAKATQMLEQDILENYEWDDGGFDDRD